MYKINKKALSELVSYVLLIVLVLAMAGGVFVYMKFYAQNPLPEEPCDGVSVALTDYSCDEGNMILTIKNTGRFDTFVRIKLYDKNGLFHKEEDMDSISVKEKENEGGITISYSKDISKIEIIPFIPAKDNAGVTYTKLCPEVKIVQQVDCKYSEIPKE